MSSVNTRRRAGRPARLGLTLTFGLALVGAACGASGTSTGAGAANPGAGTQASQTPAKVGGSMEVAAVWTGQEQTEFKKVLDAFTAKTGTQVTFTSTGDDIATVLRTRLQGGAPPDVAVLPQPGLLKDLATQGALKPIEDVAGKAVDQHYSKDWRALGTANGQLYGVFFKGANKSTVFYNVHAFQAAGVKPPSTFDDLLGEAKTIKDSGVAPFSVGGGDG